MPTGPFPGVEPHAAVAPLLERLLPQVHAEVGRHAGVDTTVHAELRARRRPDGTAELRRFYWSTQYAAPQSPVGFAARTLLVDGGSGSPQTYVFPAEPVLSRLADDDGPLRSHGAAAAVTVLRYIPLRRLTYLLHDGLGLASPVIAKVKRPGGLSRAVTALVAVDEAVATRPPGGLRVPRLLDVDEARQVLYLELLPGEQLSVAVGGLDLVEAMEHLGPLHRDLQELPVRGLPTRGTADWLHDARRAATQIELFLPSLVRQAESVYAQLVRGAPDDDQLAYCQGDFLPGQILCDAGGWSVIDLDDSRSADPLSDVAALYVGMARELGLEGARASQARLTYLEAYCRRAGTPLDENRWRWFLAMTELREIAKRLVKGRATATEATAVLERLTTPRAGALE